MGKSLISVHVAKLCVYVSIFENVSTFEGYMAETPVIFIAKKWFDAFNLHDLEMLMELYHENAKHYSPKLKLKSPETKGFIAGKKALRGWWEDCFKRLPTLKYEPIHFIADSKNVFMEYIRKVEGEDDLRVGEVLETENGLIISSRVYHG